MYIFTDEDIDKMIRFDSFVRKCIKNASKNYDRNETKKWYNLADLIDDYNFFDSIKISDDFTKELITQKTEFDIDGIRIKINDEKLANALNNLSEDLKKIIILYYYGELTDTQIAKQLNQLQQTINNRRRKALKILKKIISNYDD